MRFSAIKKRLGDLLVDVGIITSAQLKQALDAQKRSGGKLGTILSQMGLINEEVMLAFLGKQCGVSYVSLAEYGEIPSDVIRTLPESVVRHQNLIPISKEGNVVTVAMADPFNVFAIDDIKMITGYDVQVVIASESEIKSAIEKYFSLKGNRDGAVMDTPDVLKNAPAGKEAAILEKTVLSPLLSDAFRSGASRVFFEPQESFMSVRSRIDGYMKEQARLSPGLAAKVSDYFCAAGKERGETSLSCDFETQIEINDRETALSVNAVDTLFGESFSLRAAGRPTEPQELNNLGFEPETFSIFKKNIEASGGLILITGPAGSGKSLTMYSTMKALNYPDRKILSFEERIEYAVAGVTQVCLGGKPAPDLNGLKKIIENHVPDMIFIEDIMEGDKAAFAVDSALTGRTVFASMNANNCVEVIRKLFHKGIPPSLLAPCLVMISSQKLMRVICGACKETYELPAASLKPLGYDPRDANETDVKLRKSPGCPKCNNTGYAGRTAVFEILEPDEKMKNVIADNAPEAMLREQQTHKMFLTISEAALRKVIAGTSSVEEFLRLTKLN